MRVIAGEWRGRALKAPTWEGLRPTSDRLRETLFDVLGPSVRGARVLDAYAGTGAIGIEALSRGAAHVTFVERDARACRLIEQNLVSLGAEPRTRYAIIRVDFADGRASLGGGAFDLVIADPPYTADAAARALDAAATLAGPDTTVVIEHAKRHAPPAECGGLALKRTIVAGDSGLSFYRITHEG
jgi:16S rRNA (guanine(966)-N(2))-methyltransferase RsmD